MSGNPDNTRQIVTSNSIVIICAIYYGFLLILSIVLTLFIFASNEIKNCNLYFATSVVALAGSSTYYVRKIYKDIYKANKYIYIKEFDIRKVATITYFFSRPLYSLLINWLIIIGMKAGVDFIALPQSSIDESNYIYLNAFISFFVGFNIGNLIDKLENYKFGD